MLGHETLVAQSPWPEVDRALIVATHMTLPVQVNGRKRADLTIERDADAKTVDRRGAGARRRGPGDWIISRRRK